MKRLLGTFLAAATLSAGVGWLGPAQRSRTPIVPATVGREVPGKESERIELSAQPPLARRPGEAADLLPAPPTGATLAAIEVEVLAPSGASLEAASVQLSLGTFPWRSQAVDRSGSTCFRGLAPGRYTLALEEKDLPSGWIAQRDPATGFAAVRVHLSRGQNTRVTLRATRPGALLGKLHDRYGAAVGGASIEVQSTSVSLRDQLWNTRTDEIGNFELQDVPPGRYFVRASWPTESSVGLPPAPVEVEIAPHATSFVDLRATDGHASVRGRLIDSEGQALADVPVTCSYAGSPDALPARIQVLAQDRTDAQGRYRFLNLPATRVQLTAGGTAGSGAGFRRGSRGWRPRILGIGDLTQGNGEIDLGAIAFPTNEL